MDALEGLKQLEDNSVDLLCTDPPYGYSFMGKDWDKAVPSVEIWKECLRVLKAGAFAFVMSAPRSDVQAEMIVRLREAGFNVGFTPIFWTYASGFPKASNIGKMVDKRGGVSVSWFGKWLKEWRQKNNVPQKEIAKLFPSKTGGLTGCVANWELGLNIPTPEQFTKICRHFNLPFESIEEAEREVIGKDGRTAKESMFGIGIQKEWDITKPATPQAKALDGSYGGFQPKPAVEIILVAMKPCSEKTYVDQALTNRKGITWLDDCRVPYESEADINSATYGGYEGKHIDHTEGKFGMRGSKNIKANSEGRFPANLLCSDDVLNDGFGGYGDSGSFSRYFSLDAWWNNQLKKLPKETRKTFPFLIVPKASKSEKNKGLDGFEEKHSPHGNYIGRDLENEKAHLGGMQSTKARNFHPTVKPLKLMSYIVMLGSREGDVVLDPFMGSGTTGIAAKTNGRKYVGFELNEEYTKIAEARLEATGNFVQKRLIG